MREPRSQVLLAIHGTFVPDDEPVWQARAEYLNRLQRWDTLATVSARLVALAPLDQAARIYRLNAWRGLWNNALGRGDSVAVGRYRALAQAASDSLEQLPVNVDVDMFGRFDDTSEFEIEGVVTGRSAPAGTPIRLRFTLRYLRQSMRTVDVTVPAPARGVRVPFTTPRIVIPYVPTDLHYELVSSPNR
jgi:hypothetical protein